MRPISPNDRTCTLAATTLVIATAVIGVFGCAIGSVVWGVTGLLIALVGSWCLFLTGLAGLYRREQRLQQVVVPSASKAEGLLLRASDLS